MADISKYKSIVSDFMKNNGHLSKEQEQDLKDYLTEIEQQIVEEHKKKFFLARLLDYSNLIQEGRTFEEVLEYIREDENTVESSENWLKELQSLRHTMFGYPANLREDSATVEYLRFLESQLPLMNGCGDPYEKGNYQMDAKENEKKIVELLCKNLNLNTEDYWGYITSGGTEGNFWGLKEGFSRYENGILYYSNNSHYSVSKFANQGEKQIYENQEIKSENGAIDVDTLIETCKKNWEDSQRPAILLLTWGTTTTGAIDDVATIKKKLIDLNIPHYIHVDAAFFGGIPKNQEEAPIVNISELDIDSISVSLHKYIGSPKVNGVVLSNRHQQHKFIDYIGQEDSTYIGSRDFLPFSTYQRTRECLERTEPKEYTNQMNLFMEQSKNCGLKATRVGQGNIFVIKKPSDDICKKYQLAIFKEKDGEYAHIVITPGHRKEDMERLIEDIVQEIEQKIDERS